MSPQLTFLDEPEKVKTKSKNTCKKCIFSYRHEYNQSMVYCKKQKSKYRTAYGDKKIKANDIACVLFNQIQKQLQLSDITDFIDIKE